MGTTLPPYCPHKGKVLHEGEVFPPLGEKFCTVGIFRKNTSKYTDLMIEPYICNDLNQIDQFCHF